MVKWNWLSILTFSLVSFSVASQDYQVTVSSVDVWVKAVDGDGKPVTGLTMENFEIFEDGKKVTTTCFEEQMIAGSKAPVQTAKPIQVVSKKFVLFLDLFNTSVRQYGSIKPHLLEFMNSISTGGHEVMLAALMPTGRLGIIAPFTKDLVRIRILLNKAQAGTDRAVAVEKNMNEINAVIEGSPELIDAIRDAFQLARTYARAEQQLSEYTLVAIEKFAQHMAVQNLGDNSVVVYVSGGFSVDPGRQYYEIVSNLAATAAKSEEFLALSHLQERNMDMRSQIKTTLGKLNKMNATFYTIDTEGLGGESEYQDSLVEMATETGGTSFYNSKNFKVGLAKVIDDLNHQYLLCFQPPVHTKKGQYHNIKITTKRPGVDLRHRKGYTD